MRLAWFEAWALLGQNPATGSPAQRSLIRLAPIRQTWTPALLLPRASALGRGVVSPQ